MIPIRSSADMDRALASELDADLKRALASKRDQLLEHEGYGLGELAHFLVAEPGDDPAALSLPAEPLFELVQLHPGGWFEAVLILSDDGFGLALFVPDRPDTDPALLSLVRDHA